MATRNEKMLALGLCLVVGWEIYGKIYGRQQHPKETNSTAETGRFVHFSTPPFQINKAPITISDYQFIMDTTNGRIWRQICGDLTQEKNPGWTLCGSPVYFEINRHDWENGNVIQHKL